MAPLNYWNRITIILLVCAQTFVTGSHFRGGTVSWKHKSSAGNTHRIEFSFRFGWRRDSYASCTDATIQTQTLGYDGGNWILDSRGSSTDFPRSVEIKCTTFDPSENWAYGYNDFEANITANGPFSIQFTGNAWIGGLEFGANSGWSVGLFSIDLIVRSDSGYPNNPPATFSLPVIKLQANCQRVIDILYLDRDNDTVTCRYGANSQECGGICGQFSHFTLNEEKCQITYDGLSSGNRLVPVALMLSDHPKRNITIGGKPVSATDSMSSIPLQFLVSIFPSNDACDLIPTYPNFGIPENAVVDITQTNGVLNNTLYANPSTTQIAIIRFIILGPLGLQYSSVYLFDSGIYATNIIWIPSSDQGGTHRICYHAVDANNKNGLQRCFSVVVPETSNLCDNGYEGSGGSSVFDPATGKCSCTRSCWELSSDEKSCVPFMNVSCNGVDIDLTIAGCASTKTIVAGSTSWFFSQSQCQSAKRNSNYELSFDAQDCGVSWQISSAFIEYAMNIWIWECTQFGLTVREIAIVGMGTFTLFFHFFRTNSFASKYGIRDFPLEVDVNNELYFSLGAVGRDGLMFFTEKCVATTSSVGTSNTLSYTFIENGCLLDPTLKKYNSPSMENRYSIQAFAFDANLLAEKQDTVILIQCQILICDSTQNNTRCSQGCIPSIGRKRRSATEEEFVEHENDDDNDEKFEEITQSPPQFIDTKIILLGNSEKNDDNNQFLQWILIGGGIFVLVLVVLVILLVIMCKKSQTPIQSKIVNVETDGEMYTTNSTYLSKQ